MKVSDNYFDEVFDFRGQWDIPSKCGVKRIAKENKTVVLVTELYQNNPGTSITSVAASLANQICDKYSINHQELLYIECNPNMNSKLGFYDEEFYLVNFQVQDNEFINPTWKLLTTQEAEQYLGK